MDSSYKKPPSPPLFPTEVLYSLQTSEGELLKPEIFGSIENGFFKADNDWHATAETISPFVVLTF